MANTKRLTRQFKAIAEADGREFTIYEYTEFIDVRSNSDQHAEPIPGMKSLTCNGAPVNWISKGKYLLVNTGEILTSNDPDAP